MGLLSRFAGLTEHLKLEVLMQFDIRSGQGAAALRWVVVRPHPSLSDEQCRIALVALLYARTLVNNKETRVELFDRMARAARRVLEVDGKLTFDPWRLHVFRRDFSIWPWAFTEPDRVAATKTYTATLQSMARGSLAIHLKMAVGQDRVLAPSSALIAASGLATALNDSDRARLARVLLAINAHYKSPERIGLGSEPGALAAAMPALGAREAPPHPTSSASSPPAIGEHERTLRLAMAHDMGRMFGRIIFRIVPALLFVFAYGIINLVMMGTASAHYWLTYVPLVGAVVSILSCFLYPMAMFYGRSWLAGSMAIVGFIPYVFALFVMGVLGGGRLYGLLSGFSVGGLLGGLFWLAVGYAILYNFWIFTEAVSSADKARRGVLDSLRKEAPPPN
jgi:hypothetical protein